MTQESGQPPAAQRRVPAGDRAERRFHQSVLAAWFTLSIIVASAAFAPWLTLLGALVQLTGSVNASLSLPRVLYRWFAAPLQSERTVSEDQLAFERADALTGTVALAGAVFVFAGVHPLGWALVGLAAVSLALDAALDRGPLRRLADLLARLAGPRPR